MSVEAKQIFIKAVEENLRNTLTVSGVAEVVSVLTAQLGRFELEVLPDQERNSDNADFMKAFLDAKRIEGRSEKTLARYEYILNKLMDFVKVPVREITIYHVRSYLMAEKKRGISDRTLEGVRSVFSSYFGWLAREGLIARNPVGNLSTVKYAKTVKKPFSEADMELLRESCTTSRDLAPLAVLRSTGCRISEVCALNRDSINYTEGDCVVFGKGSKERRVYLDEVALMLVKRYMSERKDDSPALFTGKGTQRLTPNGVRMRLHNIAKRAGVENVHPHRFRRTLASSLSSRGMQIQEVATILGHEKLDTTMTYIHIDEKSIKSSYHKYN